MPVKPSTKVTITVVTYTLLYTIRNKNTIPSTRRYWIRPQNHPDTNARKINPFYLVAHCLIPKPLATRTTHEPRQMHVFSLATLSSNVVAVRFAVR